MSGELGRLERVDLRNIWQSEAQHFTPWLAREANLSLLAETLGIDLELEAVEKNVGPFRADILCKDTLSNRWVLIENQLERTDHTHLGQLITYAAGLDAVTIVWIAAKVSEEHRAAVDWLNEITASEVRFFALEVELWRIGDSPAAPKFNVVSQPNDWSRFASKAKIALDPEQLSESGQWLLNYWTAFEECLQSRSKRVRAVKPLSQNWLVHAIGKTGISLNTTVNRKENWIRAEVYLTGPKAKTYFAQLKTARDEIDPEFSSGLTWYEEPARDRRIWVSKTYDDVTDHTTLQDQHEWLSDMLDRLHQVFHDRVMELDPDLPEPLE